MWKLLRKDWLLNRRALGLTYLFWSILWLGLPLRDLGDDLSFGLWTGMVSAACAFLPIMMVSREDKFHTATLACSLPVTRRDIVTSRYVGGWMVALAGVAIAVAAMVLLSQLGAWTLTEPMARVPVTAVVVMAVVLTLVLPFVLRFGVAGLIWFLLAMQVLGIALLMASALFGHAGILSIETAVKDAAAAVRRLHATLGPAAFAVVAVAAALGLNVGSWRLSAWIYERREF